MESVQIAAIPRAWPNGEYLKSGYDERQLEIPNVLLNTELTNYQKN